MDQENNPHSSNTAINSSPHQNSNDSSQSAAESLCNTNQICNENLEPPKEEISRKRKQNDCRRTRAKKARESGQAYYSAVRKHKTVIGYELRKERQLQEPCRSKKCEQSKIKKCNVIDEATRLQIFNTFWNDKSWDERKSYVHSSVEKHPIRCRRSTDPQWSRRNNTLIYHLIVNNERWQVCKKMFLATLGLGEWTVLNWVLNIEKKQTKTRKTEEIPVEISYTSQPELEIKIEPEELQYSDEQNVDESESKTVLNYQTYDETNYSFSTFGAFVGEEVRNIKSKVLRDKLKKDIVRLILDASDKDE